MLKPQQEVIYTAQTDQSYTLVAGNTSLNIPISVLGDVIAEPTETFTGTVALSNVNGQDVSITTATATSTINDNDALTINLAGFTVTETDGLQVQNFVASTNIPAENDIVLSFSTTNGSALDGNDYTAQVNTVVTLLGGDTSVNIPIDILGDLITEPQESFTAAISLSNVNGQDVSIITNTDTATINDNDPATLSISGFTVNEAVGTVDYTITLNRAVQNAFTVDFDTANISALAGSDYIAVPTTTLNFGASNPLVQTVTVTIINDNVVEPTETLTGALSNLITNSQAVTILTGTATGTITDNEAASVVIDDVTVAEDVASGTAVFTVTLTGNIQDALTVNYTTNDGAAANPAVNPSDYTTTTGVVTFPGGSLSGTTQSITVPIINNVITEPLNEFYTVDLNTIISTGSASIVDAQGLGTIVDDDPINAITLTGFTLTETNGTIVGNFVASLDYLAQESVVISFTTTNNTADGTDFTAQSSVQYTIPANTLSVNIPITILGDLISEPQESFTGNITLVDVKGQQINIGIGTATGIINDDDNAVISITGFSVDEAVMTATFTITSSLTIQNEVSLLFSTSNGSAIAGSDYIGIPSTSITLGAVNANPQTVSVMITDDAITEPTELLTGILSSLVTNGQSVTLSGGAITTAIGTITDNDAATLSINDVTQVEVDGSSTVNYVFNVTHNGQSTDGPFTVDYSTTNIEALSGLDYVLQSGTLTFTGTTGETRTITVIVNGDDLLEPTETFTVDLVENDFGARAITFTDASGLGTITDNDATSAAVIANDASASEPSDNGQFTVSIGAMSSTDTEISYTITGTATATSDYIALTGTVTIPAGSTSQTIDVLVVNDAILEASETVTITLNSITSGDADITIDTNNDDATVNIADEDVAILSITANDASASEPSDNGQFTVSLSNISNVDTDISYTISGTATATTDYTTLTGTVTIPAGSTSQTIDVSVLDDTILEASETVIVTISAITSSDADVSIDISNDTATVTIADNDAASLSIADVIVTEGANAIFTVTLTGTVQGGFTIDYQTADASAVAGSDYTSGSNTLTFAGTDAESHTVSIVTTDDNYLEAIENFVLNLNNITNALVIYDSQATGTIQDNDTASLTVLDITVDEGDNAVFTVALTGNVQGGFSINYTTTNNTALSGSDYTIETGILNFTGAISESYTVTVLTTEDNISEALESFTLDFESISNNLVSYDSQAIGNITDDDALTISIADNAITETDGAQASNFVVTMSGTAQEDVVLNFSTTSGSGLPSTDYIGQTGVLVTIPSGTTVLNIPINILGDLIVEPTELFTGGIVISNANGQPITILDGSADFIITDNDSASISITDVSVSENAVLATFTITLLGHVQDGFTVNYATSDITALAGLDYTATSNTATFASGSISGTTQTFTVGILDDTTVEPTETYTITLSGITGGLVGISDDTGLGSITDNDVTLVVVTANDASASEPSNNGQFTVSIGVVSSTDTDISYTISGTATATGDYIALTGTVTIPAGSTSQTIDVLVVNDAILEASETVTITLSSITSGDAGITIDNSNDTATVTIADEDVAILSITANDATASEPGNNGQFTVSLSNISNVDTDISYTITGTATATTDYTALTGTVTIPAGSTSQTIDVLVVNDNVLEASETVIVTISAITSGDADVSIDISNDTATVTIADEDLGILSITANDATASEPSDNGQFTVSLSNISNVDTDISYTITGTATATADYIALTGTVTIPAGSTSQTIDVLVVNDAILEASETVTITLSSITSGDAGITIDIVNDTATVTIADEDLATLSITANDATASEPSDNGQFTVSLSNISNVDTDISYTISGTATATGDYIALTGTVTIPAGSTSQTIDVLVVNDAILEASETVTITLSSITSGDAGITIDNNNDTATVTIADEDVATLSITANDATASEPGNNGQFTVSLSNISNVDTDISYTITGTATATTDYTALTGTVTIPAGSTSQTIDVLVVNDNVLEASETVIVTISAITSADADVSIDISNDTASVTIADEDVAILSITANDATASEPGDNGQFTVSLSNISNVDTDISYTITGTATATSDYIALTGTVTIPAGSTSQTIDVLVVNDNVLEASETVIVTISAITSGDADVSIDPVNDTATVTIADEDLGTLSITANDATASEPSDNGQFTVSLSNISNVDTDISYTITGTATATSDYIALTGTVTIPAGSTSQTIDVLVVNDAILEASETVTITLSSITSGDAGITIDNNNDTATVTIADEDVAILSITANDATASEPGNNGQFTVSLSNISNVDTDISYTITGTATATSDYIALTGTVTIPAGSTSQTIDVLVVNDNVLEASETVIVTISAITSGDADVSIDISNDTATVTIADEDVAILSITANDATASEPSDNGQFTVSLSNISNVDTDISYTITGTATATGDYIALTGTVTIPAGSTSQTIDVLVVNDNVLEASETVIVTISAITSADADVSIDPVNDTATVTIADEDLGILSITANDASASEPSDNGQFTVSLSNISNVDTDISYTITGTATATGDYIALTGTVTIPAGSTSQTIDVLVVNDAILEASETVTITLSSITSGDAGITIDNNNDTATVTIADEDVATLSITANDATASEPGNNGQFTVSLSNISNVDTDISYTISGTATATTDYTALTGTVTIPAGSTSQTIDVLVVNDNVLEASETVIVTISAITSADADVSIDISNDTATVTIADEDVAILSITANDATASEPGDNGQFTVSLSNISNVDTDISYTITGTATATSDYIALTGTVTIPAGSTSQTIDVLVVNDNVLEASETVIVTISAITSADADVSIDPVNDTATVTIADEDLGTLSITANDATASEPSDNGQFTVSLSNISNVDTDISYTITGTATATSDYIALTGTVTIPAGSTSQTIDVLVVNDAILEASETVTITLSSITSGDAGITIDNNNDTATVTIADEDVAILSITANDATASEPGNNGQFTVSLSNISNVDTDISYTITGTATATSDYIALTGTVTIPAGSTSQTIDVLVVNDNVLEASETVIVTISAITSGDADVSIDISNDTATVTIADEDVAILSITANDATASEPGDNGQFTVSLSNISNVDTDISYTITGTATATSDYIALTGTVTIPAGSTSQTIDVLVVNDNVLEASETVIVTISAITSGDADVSIDPVNDTATVTIADEDLGILSITANDATASEPSDNGQFTVSLSNISNVDTDISYTITGTATATSDYIALTGTVTIPAGSTSQTIDVLVVNDAILEASETVTITLSSITSGDAGITIDNNNDTATVTIADEDVAILSITANDATASEPGNNGQFTVSLSNISNVDTDISYTITGTATATSDYIALTGTVTIPAGSTSQTIDVLVVNDNVLEASETVIVTISAITSADADVSIDISNDTATVTIADEDVAILSITANDATASEPGDNGQFTVSLSNISNVDTDISYTITGTATATSDYTALTGTVTIPAGSTSQTIDVLVVNDNVLEASETVIVTISAITSGDADVSIDPVNDTATVTIADEDLGTLSITANDATASEPSDNGQFTVSLSNISNVDTDISYTISGTATATGDYIALTGTVTIPAGSTSQTIDVLVVNDAILEASETVTITLSSITSGDAGITIDNNNDTATVTIADEDVATLSITANDATASEPGDNGQFTVSLSNISNVDTDISYTISGTATATTDYTALTGTVTIPAGSTSQTIDVLVVNDNVLEASETVIVTISAITSADADVSIDISNDTATVTIADEDVAILSITANDATASEPGDNGQFTVSLSNISNVDTDISYTITGTATATSDYIALTGTVTIPAGSTSQTIDVLVVNDNVLEASETVIVTISAITSGDADVSIDPVNDTATVTIADEDLGTLSITANDATASEPSDNGQFTVSLSNISNVDTDISYTITGTATATSDYIALTGTVTIPAGSTSQTIDVLVVNDAILEASETVTITLSSITSGDAGITIDNNNDTATVTIADEDVAILSITANDATASEPGNNGQFTVSLSNISNVDTDISYTITGTATATSDYIALTGTVTIPAGSTSQTIDVLVVNDNVLEASETVIVTISAITSGDADVSIDISNDTATVTIADEDVAILSITANDATASEPSDNGQFTVSLSNISNVDTDISYTITGTATATSDYIALTGTVTIPAGSTSQTIDVLVVNDNVLEASETVIVTISAITSGDADVSIDPVNDTATVTIADEDLGILSITANDASASEPSDNGQFTVSLSNISNVDTDISYTITGTATATGDYIALTGTVTIPAGSTSQTIDVLVVNDAILEASETVTITLSSITSGDAGITIDNNNDTATVTIADEDVATLSITANDATASEPGNNGQFTVSLSNISNVDTDISYTISGTATATTDYTALTGTVTIPAGSTSQTIDVLVVNDNVLEASETVIVTISAITSGDADVSIDPVNDTATVTIADEDVAILSITANDATASEPGDNGQFTVSLSNISNVDTDISYTITGTATATSDYIALTGTVTIPAGSTSQTIDVLVVNDAILEASETVTITLSSITSGDAGITIDIVNDTATVTIADEDLGILSITANDATASEPSDNGQFTVSLSNISNVDTDISYTITGTATATGDYIALTGTVTIPAGSTSQTIDVLVVNDAILEASETVTITLSSITSGDAGITIDNNNDTATVTIADEDVAILSITANDATASEPGNNGQFTVSLSNISNVDTDISYTITGTATATSDYIALTGTVTIPAGSTSQTIDVLVVNDNVLEASETVIVTISAITSADADVSIDISNDTATVTIADEDVAILSITANDATASEPGDNGQFTVSLSNISNVDTDISYTITGTATATSDYIALTGTVTIPAGSTSQTIDVLVVNDNVLEASETVIVTISAITSGDADVSIDPVNDTATVTIADEDLGTLSITANDATASEPSDNGQFTVSLSNISNVDTDISYTITGTATATSDYIALTGTVTIPAGSTSQTIDVLVVNDAILEASETVTITLSSITSGDAGITIDNNNDTATVTIADEDVAILSITANDATASEPGNNGQFTVSLSNISNVDTDISYTITGTATATSDYML